MRSIAIVFFFAFCISAIYAQTPKCKPTTKANKNKLLVYDDIEISDITWKYKDMDIARAGDSVTVKKGNAYIAGFKFNHTHIANTRYVEYNPNGTIKLIDSLILDNRWHFKRYWGEYYGSVIHTRKYNGNGILEESVYYTKSGRDSLTQKWYPAGTLYQSTWGDKIWGTDSSTHTWDEQGVLTSIKTRKYLQEFYPTGALKTFSSDTIISDRYIQCKKEYYPTGPLRCITYYCEDTPCHTWLYYTEKGKLEKTVQQASILSIPWSQMEVNEMPVSISTGKETQPEFRGNLPLYKYLNEKLVGVTCNSSLPLANGYQIKFTVGDDGKAIFENITGENHTAIQEIVKQTIEQMPQWKPGTKDGKPIKTGLTLKLYVKFI
jgi:antitoxin component YwqK of YwqJK toxin-antitoxin module